MAKESSRRKSHWAPPKIATFNKGVQVYEDIKDELSRKYKWKKSVENKLVQTDDIVTEELALLQLQFRQSAHYGKYYKYHDPASLLGTEEKPAFDRSAPMSKVLL